MTSESRRRAVRHHEAIRFSLLAFGWLLIGASPLVGLLPGPGGIFVAAGGLALVLRNSRWAKRRYVHFKRRWPKLGHWSDRGLRRPSAARRHQRRTRLAD
jgi:hypothetical protein